MPEFNELSVLVVEDDDFQRQMLVSMLRSLGVSSVFGAENGKRAIELMRQDHVSQVDIILSDLNMPEMDGLEFLRHLGEEGHNVSIVIVSALGIRVLASAASMAKALRIRILDVIEKPIHLEALKVSLSRFEPPIKPCSHSFSMPSFALEEIEDGIRLGQIQPYFQPKVDLDTGCVIGAEALARWLHPELGVVGPCAFIPQLEQSGKIDDMTFHMIEQSAVACRSLHDKGHKPTISVNLSLVSLDGTSLAERIIKLVKKVGLDPRRMILEIAETASMGDTARVSENLGRLCMNGFSLSVDDFGTGYANMQQLMRIPFSELKIDQSFVKGFINDASLRAMVESSIEIARKLDLKTVAEGVETQQDWDELKQMGCDIAQGYFIAKPMNFDEFNSFVSSNSG